MITGQSHVDTFLTKIAPTAQAVGRQWKIPPSVIIAQAALESGWGQAVKGNAYFGVKQGASTAESIAFTTHEVIEGQKVSMVDRFRTYRSMEKATHAYAQFLRDTPRYQQALRDTSDPAKFAEALQHAGYATDPQYAAKLQQIIRRHQLTAYDDGQRATPVPKASEPGVPDVDRRVSRWFGGISMAARYITVPQHQRSVVSENLGAQGIGPQHQTRHAAADHTIAGSPGTVSKQELDMSAQRPQGVLPASELPADFGRALAEFPRLLWEQIREFMWSHVSPRPQLPKPSSDAAYRA
jgi:hypothetical protein